MVEACSGLTAFFSFCFLCGLQQKGVNAKGEGVAGSHAEFLRLVGHKSGQLTLSMPG